MELTVGMQYKLETTVTENNTALAVGSSDLPVFATPMMLALMEGAAAQCVKDCVGEGNTTVGTRIESTHDAATPVGMKVYAVATVTQIDRRRIDFSVEAFDECGKIGAGTHSRFIVNAEKFMAKTNGKLEA